MNEQYIYHPIGATLVNNHTHSFQLVENEPTRLSTRDFVENEAKIQSVYHEEVKNVIQKYTGAATVMVLHHRVRRFMTQRGDGDHVVNRYAHGIHTDVAGPTAEKAYWGALKRLSQEWPGDVSLHRFRSGRFV